MIITYNQGNLRYNLEVMFMKRTFIAGLLMASAFSAPASAETIFDALSETYKSNPTLQAQRAYLRSVDENVAIARSGYRPTISLVAGYSQASGSTENPGGVPNIDDVENDGNTTTYGAKLSQPIFNGFQTVNAVKKADSSVKAEQNNLYSVEQTVFLDAATAYMDVLQNQAIVELQKNNEKLLKKRLDETIQRFNVGEVTRTDVSQARARHAQAVSDRISSEGTLAASKAVYKEIIGSEPNDLSEPKDISGMLPKSMEEAMNFALENNYSIKTAQHSFDAANYNVSYNTGALLPSVSLDASATNTENDIDSNQAKIKTDNVEVGVNMTVPLYEAGKNRAEIRQSKYLKWQSQEKLLEAERSVKSLVSSAWEYMVSNDSKIKSIKEQVKANEIALDGVQKEEALGNRTILDVLDAYQELLNSNVEEVKARRNYYVSSLNLLLAMGKLTASDLNLDVELYDADKYYQDTKGKWLSISVD